MNKLLTLLIAISLLGYAAVAQDEFVPDKGQSPAKEEPKKVDPDVEKIKKYDELLKDTTKVEGPYTLYTKKKDNKLDVYMELDPSQLGKYWFLEATLRTGGNPMGLQAGEPVNQGEQAVDAFRFERKGDQLWLYVPNLGWRWAKDDQFAIAAKRSFPEGVVEDFKIEAEHPKTKKMLIKVTDLFYGNLFDLNQRINMVLGRPYQLDREKSTVSEVKAFPENIVIRTDLYYTSSSGMGPMGGNQDILAMLGLGGKSHLADPRSLPLSVTYLIYPQKDHGFVPRVADTRVGYFTEDFFDHSKFMSIDRTTRFINRWNLKKKDPNAAMSEPVEPIVWYIDDSVPEKWKQACADGILRWNKAFEKLGYKNAVVVKMKPKDADWDHADMRYNVLRFVQSENAGYAVALFRTDPFTGEIVNAGITVDSSMLMYEGQEYQWITAPARGEATYSKLLRSTPTAATKNAMSAVWHNKVECALGEGKLESARFGWLGLEAMIPSGTSMNRDDYIKEFLADVVSHEAGHCMGLRHNFIGSTLLSEAQLADPKVTGEKGISSSVMDYVPVNMAAVAKGKGHFYSRSIGPYDVFAIEYGYKDVLGKNAEEQKPALLSIASKGSLYGNAYMTDENADSFDPYVVRFDNSSNPIDDAALTILVAKKLLRTADQRYPKKGHPYSDLARAVQISIMQTARQCQTAARFVGGVAGNRNFKGDPGEKATLAPVNPAMQREAIQLLSRELLSEDSFTLSPRMLVNLSGDYSEGQYSDAPIKDLISGLQETIIAMVLSADTTDRVANNAFKLGSAKDKFTLNELYSTVVGKVFSEVGSGRNIGPFRRDLQRFLVEGLTIQATARPGQVQEDVRMLAWDNLKRLSDRLGKAKAKEDMTSMHLRDLKRRIDRSLKSIVAIGR